MSDTIPPTAATEMAATSPTADTDQPNRLTGEMIKAMRQDQMVSVAELAEASGIPGTRTEAVEAGRATTPAERHAIAAGLARLLNTDLKV